MIRSALLSAMVLAAWPATAICPLGPLLPPCCSSPCPVIDPAKLGRLANIVVLEQSLKQLEAQSVASAQQAVRAIGSQGADQSLTPTPTVIAAMRTIPALPGPDWADATGGLSKVRSLYFLSNSATPARTTDQMQLRGERQAALKEAPLQGISTGLASRYSRPAGLPAGPEGSVPRMGQTQSMRADLAAASAGRSQLIADLANMRGFVALWGQGLAIKSLAAAPLQTRSSGTGNSSVPQAPAFRPAVPGPANEAVTLSQAVQIHNDRVIALGLLAQYPSLRDTLTALQMSEGNLQSAHRALATIIRQLPQGDDSLTLAAEQWLSSHDQTGWADGAIKDNSAEAAVAQLTDKLLGQESQGADANDAQQLRQSMLSWLDAQKQVRYWQALASDAQRSMALLDRQLAALSDRDSVDITGVAGERAEMLAWQKLAKDGRRGDLKSKMTIRPNGAGLIAP